MTGSENEKVTAKPSNRGGTSGIHDPEWADGLKRLYNSVVDEPLPDTFKDLLAQFDDGESK